MSEKSRRANSGMSVASVLLVVFVVLKLTNLINWSWWWVLSPFWIPLVLVMTIVILYCVCVFIADRIEGKP